MTNKVLICLSFSEIEYLLLVDTIDSIIPNDKQGALMYWKILDLLEKGKSQINIKS